MADKKGMPKHVYDPSRPHLGGNIEGGDPFTYYPDLWKWMKDEMDIKSVLDVGCGEGHTLDYFSRLGCKVLGVDGLEVNVAKCKHPAIVHDLCSGPFLAESEVDLVWCCEVVEHIEEKYLDHLMKTLCQGRYVAITHALPRQRGVHHVNCQPQSYWIGKFEEQGYRFGRLLTTRSRSDTLVANEKHHWRRSGCIFVRE